jgi:Uri superfamily endonuclease
MKSSFSDQQLPASPGSYLLRLQINRPIILPVGRLGQFALPAGDYIYAGSAYGPGGLRARLGRHLRGDGALHWHIDYLRAVAQLLDFAYVNYSEGGRPSSSRDYPLECLWSQRLASLPQALAPIPGFGASDCHHGCRSHLAAAVPAFDEDILLNLINNTPKPPG